MIAASRQPPASDETVHLEGKNTPQLFLKPKTPNPKPRYSIVIPEPRNAAQGAVQKGGEEKGGQLKNTDPFRLAVGGFWWFLLLLCRPGMLHVSSLSAETYSVPVEDCSDARALKAYLRCSCGFPPRFQQRLFLEGSELEDSKLLEASMELNLLLIPLSSTHKDELFAAIRLGSASQVEALLQIPQDPNVADGHSRLPLQMASADGNVDIVRLLPEARADTDLVDGHRFTALMYASNKGHAGVVELLLQAGAYASVASSRGNAEVLQWLLAAPLQMASADGNADIVRLLLEARAGTDLVDGCGDTALMRASSGGHACVVKLLLLAGADASIVNCLGGYTSLVLAFNGDHAEVVELLLAAHANSTTPSQGQEANFLDDSISTVLDRSD